jgi:hypothetical protein
MAFLYELGGIFGIDALGFAFTLSVRAMGSGMKRTLVRLESAPGETVQDILFCARYIAALVGVFDAEDKVALMLPGKQVIVENGSDASQVQPAGGARCESKPDFFAHRGQRY